MREKRFFTSKTSLHTHSGCRALTWR